MLRRRLTTGLVLLMFSVLIISSFPIMAGATAAALVVEDFSSYAVGATSFAGWTMTNAVVEAQPQIPSGKVLKNVGSLSGYYTLTNTIPANMNGTECYIKYNMKYSGATPTANQLGIQISRDDPANGTKEEIGISRDISDNKVKPRIAVHNTPAGGKMAYYGTKEIMPDTMYTVMIKWRNYNPGTGLISEISVKYYPLGSPEPATFDLTAQLKSTAIFNRFYLIGGSDWGGVQEFGDIQAYIYSGTDSTAADNAYADQIDLNPDFSSITSNLSLPTTGANGSVITWQSSNTAVISASGAVTRPEVGAGNVSLFLTATITNGTAVFKKVFPATVLQKGPLDDAKAALTWDVIKGLNTDINAVTQNLNLITALNGVNISWSSDNSVIINPDGTVTRPAFLLGDITVNLTAILSKDTQTDIKTFTLIVSKLPPNDLEAVNIDINSINLGDLTGIVSNIALPTAGANGTTITWTSDTPAVIDNTGKVTRPDSQTGDKTVILTATVTKGSQSSRKSFTVVVKAYKDVTYEDFEYLTAGQSTAALKDIATAKQPDFAKNFSTGWKADNNLIADVGDSSTLVKDYTDFRGIQINSPVYRGLCSPIDLGSDGSYYLRWNGYIAADSPLGSNVHKVELGSKGSLSTLYFGFVGNTNEYDIFSKTGANGTLYSDAANPVTLGKWYTFIVRITSQKTGSDTVDIKAFPVGNVEPSSWNISFTINSSAIFDYIGLAASGVKSPSFAQLRIERYGVADTNKIATAEALIKVVESKLEQADIDAAQTALNAIFDGIPKTSLQYRLNTAKLVADSRAVEDFSYPAGTKLNSTAAENGWATGWKGDVACVTPLSDSIVADNTNSVALSSGSKIYRRFADAIGLNNNFDYYIKWNMSINSVQNDDSASGGLGLSNNVVFGFVSDNGKIYPAITVNNSINKGTQPLTSCTDYKAYVKISASTGKLSLKIYPSNGKEPSSWSVESFSVGGIWDVLSLSFTDEQNPSAYIKFSGLCKEKYMADYALSVNDAVAKAENNLTLSNVTAASNIVGSLPDGIIRQLLTERINNAKADLNKIVPEVVSVSIEGQHNPGGSLTGDYYINDFALNAGKHKLRWYAGGALVLEDSETLPILSSYAGKSIIFEVTPYNTAGVRGTAKASQPFVINSAGSVSIGGGGGSAYAPPVPTAPPVLQEGFKDIANHWAKTSIERLSKAGIIKGIDNNTFMPDANIKRSEFTALIVRTLGIAQTEYTGGFSDVTQDNWFSNDIAAAVSAGIVSGSSGLFRPNDSITREEMAKIIISAYDYLKGDKPRSDYTLTFADSSLISGWAQPYVKDAVALGFMNGMGDNRFMPLANATRAQASVMIERLLDKKPGGLQNGRFEKVGVKFED